MSLIAIGSFKASPGVTTSALTLGATWTADRRVVVAECDPAGGDIAARFGLKQQPGLVSFAAVGRRETSENSIYDHCQRAGELDVLVGPPSSDHARTALVRGERAVGALADLTDVDILADVGRFDPASASWFLLSRAALVVAVVRPTLPELQHLSAGLQFLRADAKQLGILLIGKGTYGEDEVAQTLGVDVIGSLPEDSRTATALNGNGTTLARLARSPLVRASRELSRKINDLANAAVASVHDEQAMDGPGPDADIAATEAAV